jgi:hypothetical protein
MRPYGWVLFHLDKKGHKYPIIITEVKNRGTNDLKSSEGLKK